MNSAVKTLSKQEVRAAMVSHHGLAAYSVPPPGMSAAAFVLRRLRCIQLDPLNAIGTNADLVLLARVERSRQGAIYADLLPGEGFEHFAKERCLLPFSAFPYYRAQAQRTPFWRHSARMQRFPEEVLYAVEAELRDRGPSTPNELTDYGAAEHSDWSGWKSTSKATSLALEVLSLRCRVVVVGRTPSGKRYDVVDRAVPIEFRQPVGSCFGEWAIIERVHAAGMLADAVGPHWSMLKTYRRAGLAEKLVQNGQLVKVRVEGSRRTYFVAPSFIQDVAEPPDENLRILGPLDSLIWDRKLIQHAFDFEYVWEVYKPQEKRRYGWYVCPLLHQGRFVGRIEAHVERDTASAVLQVDRLWITNSQSLDPHAFRVALERHALAIGATDVRGPTRTVRE